MIDLTVNRIHIEMENDMARTYADPVLPAGYAFETYRDGMEEQWAQIMCSVGFFPDTQSALAEFQRDFLKNVQLAKQRMFFIKAPGGSYIASCSAWHEADFEKLHWLALRPDCQRGGLGQALVEKVLYTFQQNGASVVYLDTQTSSHRAICLYLKEGFYPLTVLHRTGEPNPNFAAASEVLRGVMRPDYYAQFCRSTR